MEVYRPQESTWKPPLPQYATTLNAVADSILTKSIVSGEIETFFFFFFFLTLSATLIYRGKTCKAVRAGKKIY
jgi:hypothetical protein